MRIGTRARMRSFGIGTIVRIAACLVVGFILAGLALAGRQQPVRAEPQLYGIEPTPQFAHTAASSCSASACHGGGQVGKLGSEHTTWAPEVFASGSHDPHSKAYRSLFNPDSVRIAKLLGGGPAHENVLCLKCHAPAGVNEPTARAEGVGCTACHGPSEKWLSIHYLPEWKAKSNRDKWTETGFVPTKNLTARISNCATCHVGSADREVNHDLIAAGHPRLAFEYARFHYQGSYRKHWEERVSQPDFEVRAWVIGQAASLRAAVDVLHSRAVKAKSNVAPWPEFAGHSCYACHQSIGNKEPKGLKSLPGWEVWYTAAADRAASQTPALFLGTEVPKLASLAELKVFMSQRNPNPAEVEKLSVAARAELDAWLADLQVAEESSLPSTRTVAATLMGQLASRGNADPDWDALAVHYLGCAAMYHAGGGGKAHPNAKQPLDEIRQSLGFPKGFNNPEGFDLKKLNGVRERFQTIEREFRR